MQVRIPDIATDRTRGFTLVEAVIRSAGFGDAGCVVEHGRSLRAIRNVRQDESRSLLLAQQLMGEIVQCAYADPSSTGI